MAITNYRAKSSQFLGDSGITFADLESQALIFPLDMPDGRRYALPLHYLLEDPDDLVKLLENDLKYKPPNTDEGSNY